MFKKLIIILILFLICCGCVSAGNNTDEIIYPTSYVSDGHTIEAIGGGDSNVSFSDGYVGYCAEWGEHSAEDGQKFYVEDTYQLNNSNYLKTMFLLFYPQTQKDVYATQHMVWKFTDDKQFSRFNQTWYNQIVNTGDKYTIPDEGKLQINETHRFNFSFKLLIPSINEFQDFFAYRFLFEEITYNDTIEINNSTNNNLSENIPNYWNNNSYIEYNDTSILSTDDQMFSDTSNNINHIIIDEKTGNEIWSVACIVILLIMICLFREL